MSDHESEFLFNIDNISSAEGTSNTENIMNTDDVSNTKDSELEKDKSDKPVKSEDKKDDDHNDEYEDVCFICRRPESKTGKMFRLPNQICVCNDCMHKTMETVSQFDYQGMLNNPYLMNPGLKNDKLTGKEDPSDKQGDSPDKLKEKFPNISFVNLSDLQGEGGIPNRQKKKKKKSE